MKKFFDRILILKMTSLFSEVATEDLRVVAEELREEACFKGERIFDVNDPGDRMYILESGKIGISINPDPRINDFISVLKAGECFGEMSLFDDQPRSATAHVIEDSILLYLDKTKLHGLIISYPQLAFGLMRGISLRLRGVNQRLIIANSGDRS